jgi:hypothetical protein
MKGSSLKGPTIMGTMPRRDRQVSVVATLTGLLLATPTLAQTGPEATEGEVGEVASHPEQVSVPETPVGIEALPAEPTQPSEGSPEPEPARQVPVPTQPAAESVATQHGVEVGSLRFDHLRIGGFFQPAFVVQGDTEFNSDDADGFVFRNARMTGEGRLPIHEVLASSFTFNFDVATGVFLVRDVYGSIHLGDDWFTVDVGQMKAPFLLAEMVSEAKLQFATPSLGMRRLAYGRDRGLRARGELVPGGVYLGWAGAMQNGEGPTVTQNSDSKYLFTGRMEVGPLGKVALDEPDLESSPFAFVIGGAVGHTSSTTRKDLGLDDAGARETRVEGDLRLHFRGLSLRAEYLRAKVNRKEAGVRFGRHGFHAQAGYVLPLPLSTKFEVVGRIEQLDINDEQDGVLAVGGDASSTDPERLTGGTAGFQYAVPDNSEVRRIEFGANAYIVDHRLKVQASYVMTDYQEGPKTEGGGHPIVGDLFQVQLQFGWM